MKITPLPTTDEVLDYGTYKVADVQDILTQDRDQAYTSLIAGIKEMRTILSVHVIMSSKDAYLVEKITASIRNEALSDIIEKVVKPLYNKE